MFGCLPTDLSLPALKNSLVNFAEYFSTAYSLHVLACGTFRAFVGGYKGSNESTGFREARAPQSGLAFSKVLQTGQESSFLLLASAVCTQWCV